MRIRSVAAAMFFLSSCSTLSNREKTLVLMGASGLLGGVIGGATAPNNENGLAHALMWGGIASASTGVVGLYLFDNDQEVKERERQIETLKRELDISRGEGPVDPSARLSKSNSTLEAQVPKEVKHLVKPGRWELYQLDQWVTEGDNQIIHQDRMFKLEPAQINVGTSKGSTNEN